MGTFNKKYFSYGEKEINYLKSRDSRLAEVIERYGYIRRELIPDLFTALIFSIIGQQISPKAADTIMAKLTSLLGEVTPALVAGADTERLRSCGISERKAGYIKQVAGAVFEGKINLGSLKGLSDEEVVQELVKLPGIGRWTAEMLLIFSMGRMDVVSFGDLGIRRGMMKVYDLNGLTREQFEFYRKRYSPYGTVASLYLWEAAKDCERDGKNQDDSQLA
ncbi:MAG TPA: DNA-3-methyladenine glycosylase 2 family protein [Clostridiales bacterium]|nr:DNA-3-methyladenine glycosylase 2 family protein [Clostridiales bacterium]